MKAHFSILIFVFFVIVNGFSQFNEEALEQPLQGIFFGGSVNFDNTENLGTSIFIDGLGIVSSANANSKNNSYSLNPTFGYQINNHWIIGIDLLLTHRTSEIDNTFNGIFVQTLSNNSVGGFMRYIINPENNFQAYISPFYRKSNAKSTFSFNDLSIDESISEESSHNFGLSIGAQYQINQWLRIHTNIGGLRYAFGSRVSDELNFEPVDVDFNSFGLDFNASTIFFGVEFLF